MKLVKICGITTKKEAEYLNEAGADFAGFIQFFPKSKRNIESHKAAEIIKVLNPSIKAVAVMVSPTKEQLQIVEKSGFSYIQIHGDITDELLDSISLPVLKAFNVNDLSDYERFHSNPHVAGYVFDAQIPGSGKTFDWSILRNIPHDEKISLLAGGLTPANVAEALAVTGLSGADTSSGVECENGNGKSRSKIIEFVRAAKS